MGLWGFGRLISSLKWTSRTWAGQGDSDREREKEQANIFTAQTNHRDNIFPLVSFFLSTKSFFSMSYTIQYFDSLVQRTECGRSEV